MERFFLFLFQLIHLGPRFSQKLLQKLFLTYFFAFLLLFAFRHLHAIPLLFFILFYLRFFLLNFFFLFFLFDCNLFLNHFSLVQLFFLFLDLLFQFSFGLPLLFWPLSFFLLPLALILRIILSLHCTLKTGHSFQLLWKAFINLDQVLPLHLQDRNLIRQLAVFSRKLTFHLFLFLILSSFVVRPNFLILSEAVCQLASLDPNIEQFHLNLLILLFLNILSELILKHVHKQIFETFCKLFFSFFLTFYYHRFLLVCKIKDSILFFIFSINILN